MRGHFPRRKMWDVGGKGIKDSVRNREESFFDYLIFFTVGKRCFEIPTGIN